VAAQEKLEFTALKCLAKGSISDLLKEFKVDSKKVTFETERFLGKAISKPPVQEASVPNSRLPPPKQQQNPFTENLPTLDAEGAANFFNTLSTEPKPAPVAV